MSRCELWVPLLAWGRNSPLASGENLLVEAQLKIAAHAPLQLLIPPPPTPKPSNVSNSEL